MIDEIDDIKDIVLCMHPVASYTAECLVERMGWENHPQMTLLFTTDWCNVVRLYDSQPIDFKMMI